MNRIDLGVLQKTVLELFGANSSPRLLSGIFEIAEFDEPGHIPVDPILVFGVERILEGKLDRKIVMTSMARLQSSAAYYPIRESAEAAQFVHGFANMVAYNANLRMQLNRELVGVHPFRISEESRNAILSDAQSNNYINVSDRDLELFKFSGDDRLQASMDAREVKPHVIRRRA